MWQLCRLRAHDTLYVAEGVTQASMLKPLSLALRALLLTLDLLLCLRVDTTEFHATSVRDAEGRVTLCTLQPSHQINACLLLHGLKVDVQEHVRQHVRQLEAEAELLLREMDQEVVLRYRAAHAQLVGDVEAWVLPKEPLDMRQQSLWNGSVW